MAWTGLTLTVEGRNALNQAQIANRINFKSIVVGDGKAPANFRTLKELVHQLYEITDIKVDMTEDGCTVTADFPKVDYDYYFREIGIIVTTDEGDRLYVYDNCGEDAQYMVSSTGVETTKKRIRLSLAISDVAEITVSAAEILYVAYDDYEKTVEILKQELQGESERAKEEEQSLTEKLQEEANRAQAEEETNRNNLVNHVADKTNPHKVTKAQVGLGNVDNTADMDKPVSTAQQEALDRHTGNNTVHITEAERTNWNDANTKKHTHSNKSVLDKITQALLDSWNAAYSHISDTVKHITAAERTLWNTVSNKVDKVSGKGLSSNDYTTTEKNKLAGIAANANNYTHPTTAGNKHIPSGGSSGQILRWSVDGTAVWGSDNNTTYSNMTAATASAAGKAGLVPAPAAGKQTSFLRGDGTWATPTDTNTWRGITDSLTSNDSTISLSAKAGKSLKDSIDTINNNLKQNTAGKFILPNGLKICWGKSKPPNTNGYIRSTVVNFPVTFNAVPVVCVTKLVSNSYTECGVTSAVGTITEKQFNIKAMYQGTALSDLEVELQWIAIGY